MFEGKCQMITEDRGLKNSQDMPDNDEIRIH